MLVPPLGGPHIPSLAYWASRNPTLVIQSVWDPTWDLWALYQCVELLAPFRCPTLD